MRRLRVRDLSVEEIEEVGAYFKADLQREANRCARRHNNEGAVAALESIEYVEKFIYTLKLRAGSQLHTLLRPPRARAIHIPQVVRNK